MDKKFLYPLIVIVVLAGVGLFLINYKVNHTIVPIFNRTSVIANKIIVLKSSEFDIKLEDGRRIHAFLASESPEPKERVVDWLASGTNPEVDLISKKDNYWIVDISLDISGKKQKLTDWLKSNGYLWD